MDATVSVRFDPGNLAKIEPRHCNSFAESNMKAAIDDGSRFMPPVQMTIQTAITATRKMMEFAKKALECTTCTLSPTLLVRHPQRRPPPTCLSLPDARGRTFLRAI